MPEQTDAEWLRELARMVERDRLPNKPIAAADRLCAIAAALVPREPTEEAHDA